MRKETYEHYGHRCSVCGCKGPKWPVECDEIWDYSADQHQPWRGTVTFMGLTSLCPGCHQVKHFGKACVDGEENLAIARMCHLNKWCEEQASQLANVAFLIWEERSEMAWIFDFTLLKKVYGIELAYGPVSPVIFEKEKKYSV